MYHCRGFRQPFHSNDYMLRVSETSEISKHDCKILADKIRNNFFKPINTYKTTIFLCGADISQKNKIRYKVAEGLKKYWQYDIIYPEDIFDELLYSSQSKDLLSLENLLAESVDAIILIPESPGSFAELGAFANDEKLRTKIVCVLDQQYKKDKSFINQGPVKLIKNANKSGVIFIDPNKAVEEVERIVPLLKRLKKTSSKSRSTISLLQLDNFLLPTIFLLESALKETLVNLVANVTDEVNAFQATTTALTSLTKKRHVELTPSGYKLTQLGAKNFFNLRKVGTRVKTQDETVALDELRLEILNLRNRKKRLKV